MNTEGFKNRDVAGSEADIRQSFIREEIGRKAVIFRSIVKMSNMPYFKIARSRRLKAGMRMEQETP